MPKDPTKNVDRYKIRGGQLNEFDFSRNQEQFADDPQTQAANLIPGTPPEKKKKIATKGTKAKKAGKKATTKKAAKTQKAAKTKTAAKSTKKTATKRTTAKKK